MHIIWLHTYKIYLKIPLGYMFIDVYDMYVYVNVSQTVYLSFMQLNDISLLVHRHYIQLLAKQKVS